MTEILYQGSDFTRQNAKVDVYIQEAVDRK